MRRLSKLRHIHHKAIGNITFFQMSKGVVHFIGTNDFTFGVNVMLGAEVEDLLGLFFAAN